MTVGRAALVGLMERFLRGLPDPFLTLLEAYKLMYFLQEKETVFPTADQARIGCLIGKGLD